MKSTFEPVKIVSIYDGCVGRELTTSIPTRADMVRTWKELRRMGYQDENLSLMYAESGRLASYVINW